MATETLYANALVGGAIATEANALGSSDSVFTTDVDNVSWTARFSMDNPVGTQANSSHQVSLRVRKETGTGTPRVNSIALYENGVLRVSKTINNNVTDLVSQFINLQFTEAEMRLVTDPSALEIEISVQGVGGSGGARTTVQLDSVQIVGDYTTPDPPVAQPNQFFAFI